TQWLPNSGLGHSTQHVLAQFIADCQADRLPAVSWVVAPYAYCEHPAARPVDGAAYVQTMLNALWSNPSLAASTTSLLVCGKAAGNTRAASSARRTPSI
ncbi:MAG: hypothetical protein JO057_30930, partial [Chloroflexi bacterium]|nr:hypothetical protein [Chloroflexota bacterium]